MSNFIKIPSGGYPLTILEKGVNIIVETARRTSNVNCKYFSDEQYTYIYAGRDAYGACVVGAIKNLDLRNYKKLCIDVANYKFYDMDGYYFGLTTEENLNSINMKDGWNGDQDNIVSTGLLKSKFPTSLTVDLSTIDPNLLKNICIYFRVNGSASSTGTSICPSRIIAY